MNELDLQILKEYKDIPIPNAVYRAGNSVGFVCVAFHSFISYLEAVLNNEYLKGFKRKAFLSIKEDAEELISYLNNPEDKVEVKHYFDLYFKSVDIVEKELKRLKNKDE